MMCCLDKGGHFRAKRFIMLEDVAVGDMLIVKAIEFYGRQSSALLLQTGTSRVEPHLRFIFKESPQPMQQFACLVRETLAAQ